MKKIEKKVISLLAVIAVMISMIGIVNINEVSAATGIGYVKIESIPATAVGGDAYITYEFSVDVDNSPLSMVYAQFSWDANKMTFDQTGSTRDNMTFANVNVAGGTAHAYLLDGTRDEKCGVTLKFTNVQENATVNYSFKDDLPTFVQFAGYDTIALSPDQIKQTGSSEITIDLPVSVAVTPASATVTKGESQMFSANVRNDDGSGVTWSVDRNTSSSTTISASGNLIVGSDETAASIRVRATSIKDPTKSKLATVTVVDKPSLSLAMTSDKDEVVKGEISSVQFTAKPTTTATTPTTITYVVSGNSSASTTVDTTGLLSIGADETADTLTVSATAVNSKTEPATVTESVIINLVDIFVSVNPTSAVIVKGTTQSFTATITNDLNNDGVVWSVDGTDSTIDTDGVLSVGDNETAATLTVTATSVRNSTKSASSTITVQDAPAISIAINPAFADVLQGENKAFNVTLENDKTNAGAIWSVEGATSSATTIDTSGVLSVGVDEPIGTTLTVKATSVADTSKVSTAAVTVKELTVTGLPEALTIVDGDSFTLAPSVLGGVWTYDDEYFDAGINTLLGRSLATLTGNNAKFTAKKVGTTTITYTVNGVSKDYEITIKEKEKNPGTGTVTYPDGTQVSPDGSVTLPDGSVIVGKDGSKPSVEVDDKGNVTIVIPEEGATITSPDGEKVVVPGGTEVSNNGTITYPDGTEVNPDGSVTLPNGSVIIGKDGSKPSIGFDKDGNLVVIIPKEGATITSPDGIVKEVEGDSLVNSDGTITTPKDVDKDNLPSKTPNETPKGTTNGTSKNEEKKNPATGDATNAGMLAGMMLLAGGTVIFTISKKKRKA